MLMNLTSTRKMTVFLLTTETDSPGFLFQYMFLARLLVDNHAHCVLIATTESLAELDTHFNT